MIKLDVEPKTPPMSWQQFTATHPPYSVAIDGYVCEGPMFDASGPWANLNHHEGVDRLATRSTCAQMLMLIRQKFFSRFRDTDGVRMLLKANACDQDVCTTYFLAKYHYMAASALNPLINRLVAVEDDMDTTAGAYPFPADLPFLEELAWIFGPYQNFRLSGGLARLNADENMGVITDVTHRILKHVTGSGDRIALDTRYERLGGGKGFALVREIGAQARTGMFSDGIESYISVQERSDGHAYVIGRMAPFVLVDLTKFAKKLNIEEARIRGTDLGGDTWGGGNTIIGSPRGSSSKITPQQLVEMLDAEVRGGSL